MSSARLPETEALIEECNNQPWPALQDVWTFFLTHPDLCDRLAAAGRAEAARPQITEVRCQERAGVTIQWPAVGHSNAFPLSLWRQVGPLLQPLMADGVRWQDGLPDG